MIGEVIRDHFLQVRNAKGGSAITSKIRSDGCKQGAALYNAAASVSHRLPSLWEGNQMLRP